MKRERDAANEEAVESAGASEQTVRQRRRTRYRHPGLTAHLTRNAVDEILQIANITNAANVGLFGFDVNPRPAETFTHRERHFDVDTGREAPGDIKE